MDIYKFEKFISSLNESYDNPAIINWTEDTDTTFDGEFYVNYVKYIIECSEWGNDIWTYKFSRIDNDEKIMDLVNDSVNKMKVLSTIRKGMSYFIDIKKPAGLIINVIDNSDEKS